VENIASTIVAETRSRAASNSDRVKISASPITSSMHAAMQSANSSAVERYGLVARLSFSGAVRCCCTYAVGAGMASSSIRRTPARIARAWSSGVLCRRIATDLPSSTSDG
jgi:hypothetical protein